MKRILIITLFLMACGLVISNSVWPIPPSPPKAAGAGTGDMTKATYDADENSKIDANKVDDLSATYQVALSLLKGTYTNTYLCKYTATGTLLDCNVDPAGFQTADADLSIYANITPSTDIQALLGSADNAAALTALGAWGISGSITDEQLVCSETTGGTNLLKSCGAKTTYTEPATNKPICRTGAGTTGACSNLTDVTPATADSSTTFTEKTFDVDGTNNVLKTWGYIILTHPHLCSAAAPIQTTSTANTYGQCKFSNSTDKATNYAEYYLVVPPDIDTSVDLVGTFKIKLGGADTADHAYEISFDSVADSAAYAGSLGDAVALGYTADGSGADGDVETATGTLTGWKAAMTAGQLFVVRVARDGDDGTNDASTVDSYSGPLVIKYKITQ